MAERTNGKKYTINVNRITHKELHRPKAEDNGYTFPIYTKVPSYKRNAEETKAESSEKYIRLSKTHYNSANNIRKIYITHHKIYIDYYKSPGEQSRNMTVATDAVLDEDILDALVKKSTYSRDLSAYQMERNINPKAIGPDQYEIEGNLFGILNQTYTCSNIEEIYFDWTFMFTNEIQQALASMGLGNLVGENAIAAFLNGQPPCDRYVRNNIWLNWFRESALNSVEKASVSRDPAKFRSKYPRLKLIAMISNLGDIMESSVRSHSLINELRQGGNNTWLTKNADLINSSNSVVIVSILGMPERNIKFVTQKSTYTFDTQLGAWFDTYIEAAKNYSRQAKYGTANEDSEDANNDASSLGMNEVEQRLLAIESEVDAAKFKNILTSTISCGFKVNELKTLFRSFTKPNRVKWAKLINLTLD